MKSKNNFINSNLVNSNFVKFLNFKKHTLFKFILFLIFLFLGLLFIEYLKSFFYIIEPNTDIKNNRPCKYNTDNMKEEGKSNAKRAEEQGKKKEAEAVKTNERITDFSNP